MYVALDPQQAETLRELISSQLKTLRNESARADSHDFREMIHRKEQVLEQLLSKLSESGHVVVS